MPTLDPRCAGGKPCTAWNEAWSLDYVCQCASAALSSPMCHCLRLYLWSLQPLAMDTVTRFHIYRKDARAWGGGMVCWGEHRIQMQIPPVTTMHNGCALLPVLLPWLWAAQNALLGSTWAPHAPSEESSQGCCGEGGVGWMEAQQQATWESQSAKYL